MIVLLVIWNILLTLCVVYLFIYFMYHKWLSIDNCGVWLMTTHMDGSSSGELLFKWFWLKG